MFDYLRGAGSEHGGLTMVLDKGMGLRSLEDLLEVAGASIQVIKLGWGTAVVVPEELVRAKIRRIRERGVHACSGGTLLELAHARGATESFLEEMASLGFSSIEVSDGTIELPAEKKLDLIRQVRERGFTVFSEVGKKNLDEDCKLSAAWRADLVRRELAAGSSKVILEARESGSLGIFDRQGEVKESFVDDLVGEIDVTDLIFEAPRKHQQLWLIRRFGPGVNLGNVLPEDAVSLETLRRGLRADTARDILLRAIEIRLDLGPAGAAAAAQRGDVVVIVDCLRASSTVVTALASGIDAVVPCSSVDECLGEGRISAGERGGVKVPGLTHGNSPIEIQAQSYSRAVLYLSTSNGTECLMRAAVGAHAVLVGCLLNAKRVARVALELARRGRRNITLIASGRENREATEDTIGATEIARCLDQGRPGGSLPPRDSRDFLADFLDSESGRRLGELGYRDDVVFCAQKDVYPVVPVLLNGRIVRYEGAA